MLLTSNQKQTLHQCDTLIRNLFADEASGHDYYHVKRVVNLSTRLIVDEANPFVVLMIAYLHDVFDDKLNLPFKDLTTLLGAWKLDCEGYEQEIELGIASIGYKGGYIVTTRTLEASIVSDADLLDSMGAIGIARAFYYAGFKGLPFHDTELEGLEASNYQEYRHLKRNAIAHFDEKLLHLQDAIDTPKGKELAKVRHQRLQSFYDDFYQEIKDGSE